LTLVVSFVITNDSLRCCRFPRRVKQKCLSSVIFYVYCCIFATVWPKLYQSIYPWDPWDYTAILSGRVVYPYIYNIRKKVQVWHSAAYTK